MDGIPTTSLPLTQVSSNSQSITNYLNEIAQTGSTRTDNISPISLEMGQNIVIQNSSIASNANLDILNDLNDSLNGELPSNTDEEAEDQINTWARQRGMKEGTTEFNQFHDIFYNNLYLNPANKNGLTTIQQALNLYDIGLTKQSSLDDYFKLLVNDTTSKHALNLYKFERSKNFDSTNIETTRKKYIDILLGSATGKQQQTLIEALKTHRVPITGEELKVSNLDKVLNVIDDPKEEMRLRLGVQGKQFATSFDPITGQSTFSQSRFDEYMNKFYDDYYLTRGLKIDDLNQVTNIFRSIKIKYPQVNFSEVDLYADALKNKIALSTIKTVLSLDTDPSYRSTVPDRNASIKAIFDKFQTGNNTERIQLEKKLKETVAKLQSERASAATIDAAVKRFAFQDPSLNATATDILNGWKETYKLNGSQVNQITNLISNRLSTLQKTKNLSDQEKLEIIDQLQIYAEAIGSGLRYEDASRIQSFEHSPIFTLTGQAKTNKLKQYFQMFASDDQERKNRFLISLRFNTIYPSSTEIALIQGNPPVPYLSFYPDGGKLTLSALDRALGLG